MFEASRVGRPIRRAPVAENEGDAHYNLSHFDAARRCYRRALERAPGSAELGSKLGLAEVRAGRTRAGLERLRASLSASQQSPSSTII